MSQNMSRHVESSSCNLLDISNKESKNLANNSYGDSSLYLFMLDTSKLTTLDHHHLNIVEVYSKFFYNQYVVRMNKMRHKKYHHNDHPFHPYLFHLYDVYPDKKKLVAIYTFIIEYFIVFSISIVI